MAETGKAVVLAVGDTPGNLDVAKGILMPEYTVKVVPKGTTALKIAEKQPPDVIVLDIKMPEVNGHTATGRICAQDRRVDLPVLAMTANATLEDQEQ